MNDSSVPIRLVQAAAIVFGREGFTTATMATVAEAAGVSKGLPYHYFSSKHELAAAVVGAHLDAVLDTLDSWSGTDPASRLRWFVRTALQHAGAGPDSYRLFLGLGMQPATRELVLAQVGARASRFATLEATLAGILSELGHADAQNAARTLRATVDGLIQYVLMTPGSFPVEEAVTGVMQLFSREDMR
jgi:TetR/AcrR family transcriptional regulator, transcriptional repressor of bet genes